MVTTSTPFTLKIGDFGQARLKSGWKDAIEGDAKYMAPELLRTSTPGKPADIFSLGVLLFQLVTKNELPSRGKLWQQLRNGQAKRMYKHVSDGLCCFMHR